MRNPLPSAILLLLAGVYAPAQEGPGGPTELLITYRCPPPRRAAFRQYMTETGIQRFEHWKKDGLLKDYRFLFNWYVDVDTWDAMAVLSFPSYAAVARWKEIERTNPGGLARDALDMAWPLNSYSADLVLHESAGESLHSVYFAIPYDVASGADNHEYANSYLAPQAKGWMREGILTAYSLYVNRYPGGKHWHGLLLLEYKDMDALSRRDEVNAKIRAQLKNDPSWKPAASKLATDREPVIADPVVPR
jgi:hypothetical protein